MWGWSLSVFLFIFLGFICSTSLKYFLTPIVSAVFTSEVTQDEAVSFLNGRTNQSKDIKEEEIDEMEALFDDIIWGMFSTRVVPINNRSTIDERAA